jgi:pyruvate formate lyase activating enzyme
MLSVHSVETFGTHEGPGIRLVLFLQGCNIRCLYCHNPDTQDVNSPSARQMSTAQVLALLEKEKTYFSRGGGLTVSGGEPTVQASAVLELFQAAKEAGFHTVLDTNGTIVSPTVRQIYDFTDLLLLDVKHIDDEWHRKLTGASNANTLANAAYREQTGKPMWLRYVLVPGWTDQPEHLEAWAKHFSDYKTVEQVEILPYHTLGVYKYEGLEREYALADVQPPTAEKVEEAREIFSRYLNKVSVQ